MLHSILQWMLRNKIIVILSVLLLSLAISTTVFAVESERYFEELQICEAQLSIVTSTPSITTTDAVSDEDYRNTNQITITESFNIVQNYRLPTEVIPKHYQIRLWPSLDNLTFEGNVDIAIEVLSEINHFILHNDGLTITDIGINWGEDSSTDVEYSIAENDTDFFTIQAKEALSPGSYVLRMKYIGKLDGIVGFYASSLNDGKMIATSKFEPTYARQAFPCFDEPAMKANYSIELVAPKDYIALSNMDVTSVEEFDADNSLYKFRESVPMSTYLACFIVCNFENQNVTINTNGIGEDFLFRVYATKEQLPKVKFSLDFGKAVTEYFIQYFKISYPLPKLDMIAIPDFVSGAMENWGLITYRETNLLFDSATTSPSNMQNIAEGVAHEISHMWFGNLVTMKWWNDLWLNEGFASYMEYKAIDELYPQWRMLDQFLTSITHSIFNLDGTLNSHPIVQTVDTPDEITAIFDSVTYNKGAAIIRMLEEFIGKDDFQSGISNYLEKHKYGNTITQDLLDVLDEIFGPKNPGINLTLIMNTWTRQMGLPVISVKKLSASTYELTQKRFLSNPDAESDNESMFNYKWFIPITYRVKGDTDPGFQWFPNSDESVEINLESGKSLLKINNDQVGYYRVNYEEDMWNDIKDELLKFNKSSTELTNSDRAHLLNDVFALAEAGEVKYDLALELSTYLLNEDEYVPWTVGSAEFSSLKSIMSNSEAYIEFREFVRSLLNKIYEVVKDDPAEDDNEHVNRLLQAKIYNLACSMGHSECLSMVENKFKAWLADSTNPVDPNLRSVIYYYGIQNTGEEEWLKLWDIFVNETDAQEKTKLMSSLAASKDPTILKRYLNLAWNEAFVRSQDHLNVVQYISSNPIGTPLVWDHVRENWDKFVEKFTLNSRTLGTTIPAITRSFATQLKLEEMEKFFADNPNAGAGATARRQAKENVQNNIKWLEKHEPTVRAWLLARSK